MIGPQPTVSVIVRCLNEAQHIGRLLSGLMEQDLPPSEIIVVDSGSRDSTVELALKFADVKVVHIEPSAFSFGSALNLGIQASSGEYVVAASAHVYPLRSSWLADLIQPLTSDPRVMVSYGRQVGNKQTKYSEHQVFRKWFPPTSYVSTSNPFCNNANAAYRREWWERCPFDESLTGLEDIAVGHQVLASGHAIAYVAGAAVAHVHDESFSTVVRRYRREAMALRTIYPSSRMGAVGSAGLFLSNVASDCYRAIRESNGAAIPSILTFRAAQFIGGYQGHRSSLAVPTELRRRLYYPRRMWLDAPLPQPTGREIVYDDGRLADTLRSVGDRSDEGK